MNLKDEGLHEIDLRFEIQDLRLKQPVNFSVEFRLEAETVG